MSRLYGDDLAFIHDVGFGGFAAGAAPGLLKILRRGGIRGGRVVDLGCGSGLWAQALLQAGYEVDGLDRSRAMIALSRRRAPAGVFRVASLWTSPIPDCDAVTAIGECLNYVSDRGDTRAGRVRLFRRVRDALRPGGLFIFDLVERGWAPARAPRCSARTRPGWAVIIRSVESGGILTRRITSFRKTGRLYRRSDEVHRLRLHARAEILSELRAAGFRVRLSRAYGRMPLPVFHVAFVARRE